MTKSILPQNSCETFLRVSVFAVRLFTVRSVSYGSGARIETTPRRNIAILLIDCHSLIHSFAVTVPKRLELRPTLRCRTANTRLPVLVLGPDALVGSDLGPGAFQRQLGLHLLLLFLLLQQTSSLLLFRHRRRRRGGTESAGTLGKFRLLRGPRFRLVVATVVVRAATAVAADVDT